MRKAVRLMRSPEHFAFRLSRKENCLSDKGMIGNEKRKQQIKSIGIRSQ